MLSQLKIHYLVRLTGVHKSFFPSLFYFSLTCSISVRPQGLYWMLQWIIKHSHCTQEVFNPVMFYTGVSCVKSRAMQITSARLRLFFQNSCASEVQEQSLARGETSGAIDAVHVGGDGLPRSSGTYPLLHRTTYSHTRHARGLQRFFGALRMKKNENKLP